MRPPWEIAAGVPDDVESLQTDVMRFIAILGLCLTAIFSLVNAAREEGQRPAVPAAVAGQTPGVAVPEPPRAARPTPVVESQRATSAAPSLAPSPAPSPAPQTAPQAVPPAEREAVVSRVTSQPRGFTLQFASAAALEQLRDLGEVALYAIAGDEYWLLGADGRARRADPPASYYRMHADTLPQSVAGAALPIAPATPVTWAITLPARTASGVDELVAAGEGGALVIGADGGVALDP